MSSRVADLGAEEVDGPEVTRWWVPAIVAVIAYVPLLCTRPGRVGGDTKQYLFLDPGRLVQAAATLWDPHVGMGTVTHQNIGYLFPMGPYFWLSRAVGLPVWVAQRLWTGSLLAGAGLGVWFLLVTLGWRNRAVLLAALAYMLTPYVFEYAAHTSAILMPWSALPWLVALVIRSLRVGGWRHPAVFALVVALVGGINATSLIFVGIAPVLWFPFAVWVNRDVTLRRAATVFMKIGGLTFATALWWIAGLYTQAGYGIDVLRFTETVRAVSQTSSPLEVVRGLGNWYFYGRDGVGPWIDVSREFTQRLWKLVISYALPVAAFAAAVCIRWRHKLYFVTLIVVGVIIGVGVHPYESPTPAGTAFKSFATSSSAGLALRTVGRAVPLVALGSAVLLGAALDATLRRLYATRRRFVDALSVAAVAVVVLNLSPLFTGAGVDVHNDRPEAIPSYWRQAAAYLDSRGQATRVLELPGADFSYYRWGGTVDPLLPGLMERPMVVRELTPYGSSASADLLQAVDRRLQEGVFEPSALPAVARLMSAGDVVLRSDLQYERYRTPRPRPTWLLFDPPPAGLQPPVTFGPRVPTTPVVPLTDETTLATPATAPDPPAVAVFGVDRALPIVRAEGTAAPVVVAGDGEGVVDTAATGLLDQRPGGAGPLLYSADLDPAQMAAALDQGATLVVTDTNRKRGQRWGTVQDNNGYTEQAGEQALVDDATIARLPVFPDAGDDASTVVEQRGLAPGEGVRASAFGNPTSMAPEDRPDQALDGDPDTAWRVAAFSDATGERLRVDLAAPVTTDHVTLVQPLVGPRDRWITKATLTFDGGSPMTVDLTDQSRVAAGQAVTFPRRSFHTLEIRIDAINLGRRADYSGGSGVGFAEVGIPGVHMEEMVRLPTDALTKAGAASVDHPLVLVMTRKRGNALESYKSDEELDVSRTFDLPTARTFSLGAVARLSATTTDAALDAALGAASTAQGVVVSSSQHMAGDLRSRAASALDGDPGTAWTTSFDAATGSWLEVDSPAPVTVDHLDLQVVADGRHSVPKVVNIDVDGQSQQVQLPAIPDAADQGAVVTVPVHFSPLRGSKIRVTITSVREVKTANYFSHVDQDLPVAVAELGLPGVTRPVGPTTLPATCRTDLLSVDGQPVGLRVVGGRDEALDRSALRVERCDGGTSLTLGPGRHDIRSAPGRDTGIDLDRLVLAADGGGRPLTVSSDARVAAPATGTVTAAPPAVRVLHSNRTSVEAAVTVPADGRPFWFVLGQSHNLGWHAHLQGAGGQALGPPQVVDGYANGWLVTPPAGSAGHQLVVDLDWAPQRTVDVALVLSALSLAVCLALAVVGPGRRPSWAARSDTSPVTTLPGRPSLGRPWVAWGRAPSLRSTVALVVLSGLAAGLFIGPWAGVLVAAVTGAASVRARARALASVGAVALLAVAGLYVVQLQLRYAFPPKIDWPGHFTRVEGLAWLAVALLAVDAVVERVRTSRPPRE